jgi:peptidoglycan/xylan/chitin deacetylase (PgdA/CDA1 family)
MARFLHQRMQQLAGQVSAGLSVLGDRAAGTFGILVYHRVIDRMPGVPEPTINVSPRRFRTQLLGLKNLSYQFWPLSRALECASRKEEMPEKIVIVTFDDGYESVYGNAFPVLQELAIPATVFVNTAFLDSPAPFPFDGWSLGVQERLPGEAYRPLQAAQCREMLDAGLIELGAHTHTHADFRGRTADFEFDLATCVDVLRDRFGLPSVPFAFPFGRRHLGYVTEELIDAARRIGVICALTTECETVHALSDPFGWGRFNVYDWDSPQALAARLRGWYGWAPRWQDRLSLWKQRLLPSPGRT